MIWQGNTFLLHSCISASSGFHRMTTDIAHTCYSQLRFSVLWLIGVDWAPSPFLPLIVENIEDGINIHACLQEIKGTCKPKLSNYGWTGAQNDWKSKYCPTPCAALHTICWFVPNLLSICSPSGSPITLLSTVRDQIEMFLNILSITHAHWPTLPCRIS